MNVKSNKGVFYYYKVYGLIVKSEVLLSELIEASDEEIKNIDVEVTYGIVRNHIEEFLDNGINYKLDKDKMWFVIEDVGYYYITKGKTIVVEPYKDADKAQIKTFLLGSAFGYLLIQRDSIAIHGGTIIINGKAIIFTGDTGAGKSTMTAAFREKGYFFMADDVSVISRCKDGSYEIYPGYPQQKLCKDTIKNMGYNPDAFKMIDDDREKYVIPAKESFINTPVELGGIIELSINDGEEVEIFEVLGSEKLLTLMKNIYRIEVTRFTGISRKYLTQCLEVTKNISIYKIKRPKGINTIDEQIDLVIEKLENRKSKIV